MRVSGIFSGDRSNDNAAHLDFPEPHGQDFERIVNP
jgi:hypothetical protein